MLAEILSIAKRKGASVEEVVVPPEDALEGPEPEDIESPTTAITNVLAQEEQADGGYEEGRPSPTAGQKGEFPLDWSGNFECLGELVVDKETEPAEMLTVYETLKAAVKSDILYVNPGVKGTSIFCVVSGAAAFLSSLPKIPRVAGWVLTYR